MQHKKRQRQIGQQKPNNYIIQARVALIDGQACQGQIHQGTTVPAGWEVRWYQNYDRLQDLQQQGLSRDAINDRLWDEACREQDTIGPRAHFTTHFCEECLQAGCKNHAGADALRLAMLSAHVTDCAFLMVSDRKTELAHIVCPFSKDATEKDMLQLLRANEHYHIQMKDSISK